MAAALITIGIPLAEIIVKGLAAAGVMLTVAKIVDATKEALQKDDDPIEIHLPWAELEKYKKSIRRGWSMQVDRITGAVIRLKYRYCYYEKDRLHEDEMEVYNDKGLHLGVCRISIGGPLNTKKWKKDRKIDIN